MNIWAVIISIEDYPNVGSGLARKLPGTDKAAEMFRAWLFQVKNVPEANIISCAAAAARGARKAPRERI